MNKYPFVHIGVDEVGQNSFDRSCLLIDKAILSVVAKRGYRCDRVELATLIPKRLLTDSANQKSELVRL